MPNLLAALPDATRQTAWPMLGQHTGRTDVQPLEQGEQHARKLAERLSAGLHYADDNKQLTLEASQLAK
jgi:hypothetical protein